MAECNQQVQTGSIDGTVEFMGIELSQADITNIHLKRVISQAQHQKFKFYYDNHSRHAYPDYGDYRESYDNKYHETAQYVRWDQYSEQYPYKDPG